MTGKEREEGGEGGGEGIKKNRVDTNSGREQKTGLKVRVSQVIALQTDRHTNIHIHTYKATYKRRKKSITESGIRKT